MILKKRFLFLICTVFALISGYGQINLDSLSAELDKLPNDTLTINKILRQGLQVRKNNLDAGLVYFKWTLRQSRSINDKACLVRSLLYIGGTYNLIGDFGSAAENLIEALQLAEKTNDKELVLRSYIGLGNMYAYSQQTGLAKGMYLKALKTIDPEKNRLERATILNNIGAITYRESNLGHEQLQVAVSYFLNALAIIEESGNPEELIDKYNNLGLIYCDMDKQDSALYYLAKSKKIIDLNASPDYLITYYNYLGRVYVTKREFAKGEEAYMASLKESKKLNDKDWIYENYLSLAGMYENKLDFEKAFEYYRQYSLLKDSVTNESNFAIASDIKNKFEREKREVELNQLKAEQSKNKIFNIALIVVSILVVISGIMMYSRFKIKAESEKKLQLQNHVISQKNKDITDSITYARKIQRSILPSERFIGKEMKRLRDDDAV
jgi:tetratricopeptide (TPR) repeat protein